MLSNSEKKIKNSVFPFSTNKIIFKKYKILKIISEGIFGQIYLVINEKINKFYAMKIENRESNFHLLEEEGYNLYSIKGFGIPDLISFGKITNYDILIEELLGKSLNELFLENNYKFSIQDICLISIQLIDRLEWIHSKTLIHRDLKPENFLIGLHNPNTIYLTEFGLCTKYCSSKTGKHILPGFRGTFTGTLKFSSANAQRGNQQSRRDDIESLGYSIIYFMKGKLPWMNLNQNNNEKDVYLKTYAMKKFMPVEKLCKGLPSEMEDYFKYVKMLKFQETPKYDYLRNLFKNILRKNGVDNYEDINLSWVNDPNEKRSKSQKKRGLSPKSRLYLKIKNQIEANKENESDLIHSNIDIKNSNLKDIKKNSKSISYKENSKIKNTHNNNEILTSPNVNQLEKEKNLFIKYNTNKELHNNNINDIQINKNVETYHPINEDKLNNFYKNINEEINKKNFNSNTIDINRQNIINKENNNYQRKNINPKANITKINLYNNRYNLNNNNNDISYQLNTYTNINEKNKIHMIKPITLNNNLNYTNINNNDNDINYLGKDLYHQNYNYTNINKSINNQNSVIKNHYDINPTDPSFDIINKNIKKNNKNKSMNSKSIKKNEYSNNNYLYNNINNNIRK